MAKTKRKTEADTKVEHTDIVIVGAGISGIGAAWHFRDKCPDKKFIILEKREKIGGTWSLFNYPGVRSDSDMHTLGYNFKPWRAKKSIADGASIMSYLDETVAENNISQYIRLGHEVTQAAWSSKDARWTVTVSSPNGVKTISCNFLYMCSGYYDYDQGHMPEFKGAEDFKGTLIHPQHWPEDLDYSDNMADQTRHITMLQRTPTYMISYPDEDWLAKTLRPIMPDQWAYNIVRARNIRKQHFLYQATRKNPKRIKKILLHGVKKRLDKDYDIETHFTPHYNPWDQRLCLIPNGDFLESIKSGKAEVVTDHIDHFTPTGIKLKSGGHIDADIIISATGLNLKFLGGLDISIDGKPFHPADSFTYEGIMYSGVPNLVTVFGYVNYSWTLRADLISEFFCNLINAMDAKGASTAMPQAPDNMTPRPWIDFDAGYIQRKMDEMPKQGDHAPWVNTQNYIRERKVLATTDFPSIDFSG